MKAMVSLIINFETLEKSSTESEYSTSCVRNCTDSDLLKLNYNHNYKTLFQMFFLTSDGELRHNTSCVSITTQYELVLTSCDRHTSRWNFNIQVCQCSNSKPFSF